MLYGVVVADVVVLALPRNHPYPPRLRHNHQPELHVLSALAHALLFDTIGTVAIDEAPFGLVTTVGRENHVERVANY
jgi:hypothetical protein